MNKTVNTRRTATTAPTAIPTTTPVELLDDGDGGFGGEPELDEGGVSPVEGDDGVSGEGGDGRGSEGGGESPGDGAADIVCVCVFLSLRS